MQEVTTVTCWGGQSHTIIPDSDGQRGRSNWLRCTADELGEARPYQATFKQRWGAQDTFKQDTFKQRLGETSHPRRGKKVREAAGAVAEASRP